MGSRRERCQGCSCDIGAVQVIKLSTCPACSVLQPVIICTYMGEYGEINTVHIFRVHNHYCPECGMKIERLMLPCQGNQIDVTEEFVTIERRSE